MGLGHGLAYLTVMIHASEIVNQKLRGGIISIVNFEIVFSMMIFGIVIMFGSQESALFPNRWLGIWSLINSVTGLCLTSVYTQESPVKLIRERKLNEALLVMIELRSETIENESIRNEFEELRLMVEEDERSKELFKREDVHPLHLIVLLKVASVIALNFCVNIIRLKYTTISLGAADLTVMTFMVIRLVGCFTTFFTVELIGRRPHFILSFGGSSILLIAIGVVVAFKSLLNDWIVDSLQLSYEFLGGLGVGVLSDIYAAEAFNTFKKPKSVAFVAGIEMALHALIISATFSFIPSERFDWIYLSIAGVLLLSIAVYLIVKLPETAGKSIRQTRNEFEKPGNRKTPAQMTLETK